MNDNPDQTIIWSHEDDLPKPPWTDDNTVDERSPVGLTGGLVNLAFFTAALSRRPGSGASPPWLG